MGLRQAPGYEALGDADLGCLREISAVFSVSSIALFDSILAESSADKPGSEALSALMGRCPVVMVFRRLCGSGDRPLPWRNAREDDPSPPRSISCSTRPSPDRSVESLAHAVAMSRTVVSERSRDAFRSPPMMLPPREIRPRRTADLLGEHSANVGAVAGRVGVHSWAHRSTTFRERFGITPGAYRQQMSAVERSEGVPPPRAG